MIYVLFLLGLVFIVKAGDFFVDSSINIAKYFHVSDLVIGATIVSIGTTLPETIVSATSAFLGYSNMAYGNAIGSIICNSGLILGLTLSFSTVFIKRENIKTIVIFYLISFFYYFVIAIFEKRFEQKDGMILLFIYVIYMSYMIYSKKEENRNFENKSISISKSILVLIISALFLGLGSRLLVDNGTIIARNLGISEAVIGITVIALGTSLPELITSLTALKKGHPSMSVGNIMGANLLNLIFVSAAAILIRPFDVPKDKILMGINSSIIVDIPLSFLMMLIITLPIVIKNRTYKFQGILLLLLYALFCIFQYFY